MNDLIAADNDNRSGFFLVVKDYLPLFSLSLCGLVAIRIWIQCNIYDLYTSTDSGIVTIITNLTRVVVIVLLLAIAIRQGFVGRSWLPAQAALPKRALPVLGYVSVFLMTLSSALFFISEEQPGIEILIVACVCAGAGIAWGGGMWICHYARLQPGEALLYAFISLGVSSALGFVLGLLPTGITYLISMLMPPLSMVLYQKAQSELDARDHEKPTVSGNGSDDTYDKEPKRTFVRLLAGIVCFNLVLGIARGFPTGASISLSVPFQALHQFMVVALSLCLIWWALGMQRKVRFSTLWTISVTLIVLGVLLLAFLDDRLNPFGGTLISISNTFAVGLLWFCCYDVARHSSVPAYVVLGVGWVAHILPREIGRVSIWLAEPHSTTIMLIIAFMVLALSVAMVLMLSDSIPVTRRIFAEFGEYRTTTRTHDEAIRRLSRGQEDGFGTSEVRANEATGLDAQLATMGKRYFLTERETEIVKLLAQGQSRAAIGKKLYITENTVRTHLKSVYSKLGIHNKQELVDLLEATGSERI